MSDLISKQVAITIPITPKEDREYQTYNLDDAYERGWEDLEKKIEQLPSADAITIEWLNEYAHKLIKLEQRQPVAYRWFSVLGENILQMIHDWRKENGKV